MPPQGIALGPRRRKRRRGRIAVVEADPAAPRKRELSTLQMRPPNRNLSPLFLYPANVYDLEMDFCGEGHGFLLQAGEDARVLELMKKEETDRERKVLAEDKWASTVRHLCSGSFIDKVRGFFR